MLTRVIDAIFARPEPLLTTPVIEIKEGYVPHKDDEESIRSLATHPGFVALCHRFDLQRAALRARLEVSQDSIRDIDSLQEGIRWIGFHKSQVDKAVFKKQEAKAVAAKPYEQVEFEKVIAFYEGV